MMVWRGFTLTVWVVLLALSAAFILLYQALGTTVLDADKTKGALAHSRTYDTLRDTVLTDRVSAALDSRYPDNRLVDAAMVRQVLAAVLPAPTLAERLDPAVTNLYRWLDSKEESINFTVSLADKKDPFYRALESALSEKLTAIDSCGDSRYPPEEALLEDRCLPAYITAKEATQAVMGSLRAGDFPLDDTISPDSLFGPTAQRGQFNQLPTYLNIVWTLNLLAIAAFVAIAIFVLVTRKSLGLIALGVSLALAGIVTVVLTPFVSGAAATASQASPLAKAVLDAVIPPFATTGMAYGLATILAGVLIGGLTAAWRWRRNRHA